MKFKILPIRFFKPPSILPTAIVIGCTAYSSVPRISYLNVIMASVARAPICLFKGLRSWACIILLSWPNRPARYSSSDLFFLFPKSHSLNFSPCERMVNARPSIAPPTGPIGPARKGRNPIAPAAVPTAPPTPIPTAPIRIILAVSFNPPSSSFSPFFFFGKKEETACLNCLMTPKLPSSSLPKRKL